MVVWSIISDFKLPAGYLASVIIEIVVTKLLILFHKTGILDDFNAALP
jgi:hypothetical protein